jgi:thymidylate synthase (FAD)
MGKQNNQVQLIGHYGGDIVHACSAWTSTSRSLTEEKRERIPKLLRDLAGNGHETPFEKSTLHFLVDSEIASHIHILKHRIGVSLNAESARYKELKEDKFYVPEDFAEVPVDPKHGMHMYEDWAAVLYDHSVNSNRLYHQCLEDATKALGRKRAKESARFFKPYNSMIESDVMFNFRSFVHFQRLRNSEHAQKEIRDIAGQMLALVSNIEGDPFKHSIEAFNLS